MGHLMYIVFDTNIWRSQLGFNSEAGAAVRFYIQQKGASVAIPEVVRIEVERRFALELQEQKKRIVDSHRQLLTVFGKLKEVVLPSDEEIRVKASKIIEELDVPMREIPFSLEAAKSSFLKTIHKLPPSSNNSQQFKDGVIWADCLELLKEADVYLVSQDKGFYENGKYEKGLASNFLDETKSYSHKLKLISDLSELLEDIRQEIEIDEDKLVESVLETSQDKIQKILEETEFSLGNSHDVTKKLFLTGNSTQLYIEFEILCHCLDATEQGRLDAGLKLKGFGSYETKKQKFLNIDLTSVLCEYITEEGQEISCGVLYITGGVSIGSVEHTVRSPLLE